MASDSLRTPDVDRFHDEGYLVVRGLVGSEARARMLAVAQEHLASQVAPLEYEADLRYPGAPLSKDAPGGRTVRRLLHAYARDAAFRDWATCTTIKACLESLIGRDLELSQAHHNCIMTKSPRYSSVTGWHQDIRYWAFERPELISVWLALGEERRENGCLLLLPRTHRMDFAGERLDDAKFLRSELADNRSIIATQVEAELDPGDVLFFHCRLFHAAGNNHTQATKYSLVYTYHAADNRPLPNTRSASLPDLPL